MAAASQGYLLCPNLSMSPLPGVFFPCRGRWTAPEVFQDQVLTRFSDVWSFGERVVALAWAGLAKQPLIFLLAPPGHPLGVTFWEIVTQGGTPYEGLSNKVPWSPCLQAAAPPPVFPSPPHACSPR